jgi:hypothetical protein
MARWRFFLLVLLVISYGTQSDATKSTSRDEDTAAAADDDDDDDDLLDDEENEVYEISSPKQLHDTWIQVLERERGRDK